MSTLKTHFISGAGNTFLITWGIQYEKSQSQKISQQLCKQAQADGFIFLNKDAGGVYFWNFYNSDGSAAEMCGNATRCVAWYIKYILHQAAFPIYLKTLAGVITIDSFDAGDKEFQVQMTPIQKFKHESFFHCDTGVPHVVVQVPHISKNFSDHFDFCKSIRWHKDFQPKGTNVTLVEINKNNPCCIKAVSFERGVENFTQACGTGAMAAAFYNLEKYKQFETEVSMPGGTLYLNLSKQDQPLMTGGAKIIGELQYEI